MKVGELREKLRKMKQEEVIRLAVEFYKRVPKAKKEEYDLDDLINNPTIKSKPKSSSKEEPLGMLQIDINTFISNAKSDYYLMPNKVVPKKERPKWRFKVKRWYKTLTDPKRTEVDFAVQASLLSQLYELMAISVSYFTSDDCWASIGIEQEVFLRSVLNLYIKSVGKTERFIDQTFKLIEDYGSTYSTHIMDVYIDYLNTDELILYTHKKIRVALAVNNFSPDAKSKRKSSNWSSHTQYRIKEKHNKLILFNLKLFFYEEKYQEGIQFFEDNFYRTQAEVKLYILVREIFPYNLEKEIQIVIEKAISNKIKPRESLINLLAHIKEKGTLPKYIR